MSERVLGSCLEGLMDLSGSQFELRTKLGHKLRPAACGATACITADLIYAYIPSQSAF